VRARRDFREGKQSAAPRAVDRAEGGGEFGDLLMVEGVGNDGEAVLLKIGVHARHDSVAGSLNNGARVTFWG
jgi:hypothetical protein